MTSGPQAWSDEAVSTLIRHGYREVSNDGASEIYRVMRRSDFKVAWFCTRLHTFVVIGHMDFASEKDVQRHNDAAVQVAKRRKGGLPRGFQTGIAVLPVLVCVNASDEARSRAGEKLPPQFSLLGCPVLVELDAQKVISYSDNIFWGGVYQDFIARQQRLLAGSLEGETLQPRGSEKKFLGWLMVVCFVIASVSVFGQLAIGLLLR